MDKNRFDALMALANYHFTMWEGRARREQWPVTLGVWGLIGGAIAWCPPAVRVESRYYFGFAILVVYVAWILRLTGRNYSDRAQERAVRACAFSLIRQDLGTEHDTSWNEYIALRQQADKDFTKRFDREKHWYFRLAHPAVFVPLLVTLLLVIVGPVIIGLKQPGATREISDVRERLESLQSMSRDIQLRLDQIEKQLKPCTEPGSRPAPAQHTK